MRESTTPRHVRVGIITALLVVAATPVVVAAAEPVDELTTDAETNTPEEQEPNDGQEEAQTVTAGEEVTGALTSGDVDWFKFTVERGKAITVSGSTDEVGVTNFELVDSNGNQLDGTSGGLKNKSGNVGAISPYTGTYYVRVERRFTDRGGEYSLTVETTDTDAFEPNEIQRNGTDVADEEEITGELTRSDADWFNVTAERGDEFNITAYADSNGTTTFQVHASNGTVLTGEDAVSGELVRVNVTAPYTGTYSVEVSPRFEGKYGAAYNLTVDLPGDPSSNADGSQSGETQTDGAADADAASSGLRVVPIVAGIAVVLVVLVVALWFRDGDDGSL